MYADDKVLKDHTEKILSIFNSYASRGNREYKDIIKKNFFTGVKYEI